MKKRFIQFLSENNALRAFVRNIKTARGETASEYLNRRDTYAEPLDYLWGAFVWESTPEGHPYWSDLHWKWDTIMSNMTNEFVN